MEIRILKTELVDWRSIEPLQPANFKHIYNYKHIERSILENGFVNPFFVWESEGIIYSIDGVTRKEILSNLENVPELLPAVFIDAKNRQDAVKILLSVFNTKENPIDLEVLTEWVQMEEVEVEITSLNVVDVNDVQDEAQEILEAEEDDFDSTLPETPETVLGDLYEIGEHRLLCGDSTDSDLVNKLLDGKKPELLLTDPPYGIDYGGMLKGKGDGKGGADKNGWKSYDAPDWDKSKPENGVLQYLCQITDNQIIWGGNYFTDDLPPTMGWLIWDKGQRGFSLADGEMAWTSFNNALRIKEYARAKANREEKNHPTQKPQEIMNWCFEYSDRHSKQEIKLVLDAYLGSGSTMVASHQLKRKCYGMELDPKYCDVIIKRMIKLDSNLKVKRNGIDETKKWLDKIK